MINLSVIFCLAGAAFAQSKFLLSSSFYNDVPDRTHNTPPGTKSVWVLSSLESGVIIIAE